MTEHTPTPWTLDDDGDVIYLWVDAVKDYVGMTSAYGWGAPHKANAEFICKAVNNHDALVKALQAASEYLESDAADGFRPAHRLRAEIDTAIRNAVVGGERDPS